MKLLKYLVCLLLITTNIYAFDGNRKGFLLGGGLGIHAIPFKEDVRKGVATSHSVFPVNTEDKRAIAYGASVDLFVGYGISPKTVLFFDNNIALGLSSVSWSDDSLEESDSTYLSSGSSGLLGLQIWDVGCRYYIKDDSSTLFVSAVSGPMRTVGDIGIKRYGPAFGIGVGYEFKKHRNVEFKYHFGKVASKDDSLKYTYNLFQVVFSFLGY